MICSVSQIFQLQSLEIVNTIDLLIISALVFGLKVLRFHCQTSTSSSSSFCSSWYSTSLTILDLISWLTFPLISLGCLLGCNFCLFITRQRIQFACKHETHIQDQGTVFYFNQHIIKHLNQSPTINPSHCHTKND